MTKSDAYNHTELVWEGKYEQSVQLPPKKHIEKVSLPFQPIEIINEPREGTDTGRLSDQLFSGQAKQDWRNKLIWGDNKLVMSSLLAEYAGKIDLIYIDPPFDVGADFSIQVKIGDEEVTKAPSILEEKAYRDTWGKGTDGYLQMLYERLLIMRELLSVNGSIYIHLDWHIGHYVKVIMDEIFGDENFIQEIIWNYGSPSGGRVAGSKLVKSHDYILCYARNYGSHKYNIVYLPYSEKYVQDWFKYADSDGRRYRRRMRGYDADSKVIWEKQYLDESKGAPASTVWTDIKSVYADPRAYKQNTTSEILNYPTQKPEKLIGRIIEMTTSEGDLIADFFCGSGTTASVAEKLGRRWIIGDLGRFAVHTSRKRLMGVQRKLKEEGKDYYPFEILNLGKYERQHWQVSMTNGQSEEAKRVLGYYKFIIELYQGEVAAGFTHLHGKKAGALIHIGAVDAPVTMSEIRAAVEECLKNQIIKLDLLGWEWEMGVNEEAVKWAKAQGVRLRLFQIPREVMDKRATDKAEVRFFELNHVEVDLERRGQEVTITLKSFAIPSEEFIPSELRERITNWADLIDYWSVDWDYNSLKSPSGEPIFQNDWQTFRTKKSSKLELNTPPHRYPKSGQYTILVKVVDIFGNDTSKVIEAKV